MKHKFQVLGWSNGEDYDAGKLCDMTTVVTAVDESEAEDIGDRRFKKKGGATVVEAVLLSNHKASRLTS